MRERFLRSIRLLAECFQAFEQTSGRHVRELGLTPPQFDIVVTLGRTSGLSCRELGDRTLITKGTLTGVLNRLEARGVLTRAPSAEDRRSVIVRLTAAGETLFEQVFPTHVAYLKQCFADFDDCDLAALEQQLSRLRQALAIMPCKDAECHSTKPMTEQGAV